MDRVKNSILFHWIIEQTWEQDEWSINNYGMLGSLKGKEQLDIPEEERFCFFCFVEYSLNLSWSTTCMFFEE